MTDTIGTPDWQRGIVNPELLVGTAIASATTMTVTVPPNTESLVVGFGAGEVGNVASVVGVTSGIKYPVQTFVGPNLVALTSVWYAAVAPSIDISYVITLSAAPGGPWYAVADAGIRQVIDMALVNALQQAHTGFQNPGLPVLGSDGSHFFDLQTDSNGRIVPIVPTVGIATTSSGVLIAAPGSGANYLFSADLFLPASTVAFAILTTPGNTVAGLSAGDASPNSQAADHADLDGFRTTGAVSVNFGGAGELVVRYAPGP